MPILVGFLLKYNFKCILKLSSLKGEAELRNITLDNEALQDLLDLPTWIRINRARVNSVSLKIQWTSLQSKPIRIRNVFRCQKKVI